MDGEVLKIPRHLFAIVHTRTCRHNAPSTYGRAIPVWAKQELASWYREEFCRDKRFNATSCRLIRYDRQGEAAP